MRKCENVLFGETKGMSKIRHPSALPRAGLTAEAPVFGIQRSFPNPLPLYLSLRGAESSGFSTHSSSPPEPAQTGRNPPWRKFARWSAAGSAGPRPARRSAQPTCPIWGRQDRGIRGTRGIGSPLPRPTPPGLQGRVIVRRQPPSRGPAPTLPPRIRFGTREGMKNDGLGPLGMHFFIHPRNDRGEGF